jgi:hypothetical protein
MSPIMKAMGRALRDGPNEIFFRAGYWNGHLEWIDNRVCYLTANRKSVWPCDPDMPRLSAPPHRRRFHGRRPPQSDTLREKLAVCHTRDTSRPTGCRVALWFEGNMGESKQDAMATSVHDRNNGAHGACNRCQRFENRDAGGADGLVMRHHSVGHLVARRRRGGCCNPVVRRENLQIRRPVGFAPLP